MEQPHAPQSAYMSRSANEHPCAHLRRSIQHESFLASRTDKLLLSAKKLANLLTKQLVCEVLACVCENCNEQRSGVKDLELPTIDDTARWVVYDGPRIFALLLGAKCPQLIYYFLFKDCSDAEITTTLKDLTAAEIARRIWPLYDAKNPCASTRLADLINDLKWQYFVPVIHDRVKDAADIQDFDANAVLPIEIDQIIGRGAWSTIFTFKLIEEYMDFQAIPPNVALVRKEVKPSQTSLRSDELSITIAVNRLGDENLVRLVTAYKHGNDMNYVFIRADSNLEQYLTTYLTDRAQPTLQIDQHCIWQAMLGVFRAIYRIYRDVYVDTSGKRIRLYHLDIKPANILVEFSQMGMKLLVADFGMSRSIIEYSDMVGSDVPGRGGNEAYTPPVGGKIYQKRNHRYDVWSLGCILLEICAFAVEGPDGVKKLDDTRLTEEPPGSDRWDDFYWRIDSSTQDAEIKPSVIAWMKALPSSNKIIGRFAREFTEGVIDLAMEMLAIDPSERIDAEGAQAKLYAIIKRAESGHVRHGMTIPTSMMPTEEEIVNTMNDKLRKLVPLDCKHGHMPYYKNVKLQLCVYDVESWRLELWSDAKLVCEIDLGRKGTIHIRPTPAVDLQSVVKLDLKGFADPRLTEMAFHAASSMDAAILQSAMLGQTVRSFGIARCKSLPLKSLKIEPYTGTHKLWSNHPRTLADNMGSPSAVQIWCEESPIDLELHKRERLYRHTGRFAFGVAAKRVIIFCEKAVIVLPFAINARLEKPSDKYSGLQHRFTPTDSTARSKDPSLVCAVMILHDSDRFAMSVHRDEFLAVQQQYSIECTNVAFELTGRPDWAMFQKVYRVLKKEWKEDWHRMGQTKFQEAASRGWAPVVPDGLFG